MIKRIQVLALLVAAGALLAVPAVGQAHHTGKGKGNAKGHGKAKGKSCADNPSVKKGFVVKGTFVSATATSVTIAVTGANRHARVSGALGAGPNYTVTSTLADTFAVVPSGYVPALGDKVRIVGKITVIRKKCAPGVALADRYTTVDIRRVKIIDVTP